MLREIEHGIRVLQWQKTEDATKNTPRHYPQPIPLTEDEAEALRPEREKYDALPIDEMREWLGWDD